MSNSGPSARCGALHTAPCTSPTSMDSSPARNLYALAALRHAIISAAQGRVREALLFAFTAAVNRASRRYQWKRQAPD